MSSDDDTTIDDHVAKGLNGSKRRQAPQSDSSSSSSESEPAVVKAAVGGQGKVVAGKAKVGEVSPFSGLSQLTQLSSVSMVPTAFAQTSPWAAAVPQYWCGPGAMPPFFNSIFQAVAQLPPMEIATMTEELAAVMAKVRELEQQVQHVPAISLPAASVSVKKRRATKKQKNNGENDADKKVRKVVPLPPQLAAFCYSPETRDHLALVEELATISQQTISVAHSITTGSNAKGNKIVWIFDELHTKQLRKLCKLVGCKNLGSVSKYLIRKETGRKWTMGPVYNNFNIPNPATEANTERSTRYSTLSMCAFF
jgi:hypothetical protein